MSRKLNDIQLNATNNSSCPCRNCHTRYMGCHDKCLKYIDWKQLHEVQLLKVRKDKSTRKGDNKYWQT